LHAFAQLPVGDRVILARLYVQRQDPAPSDVAGDTPERESA
jgi:hypothetical protein